ncbi:hypothetical protein PUNSTDRAFT_139700 [Punctularia strigosozonata HHB-11173 SS5]|uniref:Uncharacterized protein n=1 Tax=Punctularia strigosozonata (strain HHB-11173) TaxID=741275 RepID=R7RZ77_PUNST|nr:uncharacterized protein PUNSTDRAFT_139700 [Punctularia strigosozonata HHB-11173 SS5]EIN03278.1 hypothetical protein PUNSTDRAFT_139700 [Punctularia strigosozonata HHB-11173 SS5]
MSAPATESEESATAPSAWSHIAAADAAAAAFDYRLANRQHDTDSDTTPSTPDTVEREAFERAIARAVGPLSSTTIAAANGYRPLVRRRSFDPDNVEEVPETPDATEREAPRRTIGDEARLYARPMGTSIWYRLEATISNGTADQARSMEDIVSWFDTTFILSTNERRRVVIGLGPIELDDDFPDTSTGPLTPPSGRQPLHSQLEGEVGDRSTPEDEASFEARVANEIGDTGHDVTIVPTSSPPSPLSEDTGSTERASEERPVAAGGDALASQTSSTTMATRRAPAHSSEPYAPASTGARYTRAEGNAASSRTGAVCHPTTLIPGERPARQERTRRPNHPTVAFANVR